ncbi:MAG: mycothiol system anti-sigma-R factor [Nitriliruptoraceae bacterium]
MTDEPRPECGPECQAALERLEAFLDGELPHGELGDIQEHLADCHPCTDRASFEEQLRAVVRHKCVDQAPPSLLERVRTHLGDAALG